MKHFLIVTNDGKDKEYKVTDHVKNLLEQAGMTCVICEKDEKKQIIREAVPKELDCAIVIGGDGSFIEAARVLEENVRQLNDEIDRKMAEFFPQSHLPKGNDE